MIFTAIDIEMDKNKNIIQVGACLFNTDNKIPDNIKLAEAVNIYIKYPDTPVIDFSFLGNDFFPDYLKLAHEATSILPRDAAYLLALYLDKVKVKKIFQWGSGDYDKINKDLFNSQLKLTAVNIKLFYQYLYAPALGLEKKYGLRAAVEQAGLEFIGEPHDALYDAFNTGRLFCKIYQDLKKFKDIKNLTTA